MSPPLVRSQNLDKVVRQAHSALRGYDIAWVDNKRGVSAGSLSCLGKNITDQRLVAKDGATVPVVRTENYDETLGPIDAGKIECGHALTFEDVWANLEKHIEYMGYRTCKRPSEVKKVVMRFQNAFVGVTEGESREVVPSNFSYQTSDEKEPRNLLLVVTPTGIYAHTDGVGYKNLFSHVVSEGTDGVKSHWFQAEETDFAAGHAQVEDTKQNDTDKKTARVTTIGVKGSGARCNRMLIFSVPLKKKPVSTPLPPSPPSSFEDGAAYRGIGMQACDDESDSLVYRSLSVAQCRAARLNIGDEEGEAQKMEMDLEVDDDEPVMCTQIDYNVLVAKKGRMEVTISDEAAEFVAKDIWRQYQLCDEVCKLSELPACLHKLEKSHLNEIDETKKAVIHAATANSPYTRQPNALAAFL